MGFFWMVLVSLCYPHPKLLDFLSGLLDLSIRCLRPCLMLYGRAGMHVSQVSSEF
jgi:hypothetical protein